MDVRSSADHFKTIPDNLPPIQILFSNTITYNHFSSLPFSGQTGKRPTTIVIFIFYPTIRSTISCEG